MAKNPKQTMRCGEVRKSTRSGKKIMKLYCTGGKRKLVHAGATGYGHNYSPAARKSFRARHKCDTAKAGTARHLALSYGRAREGAPRVLLGVARANTRLFKITCAIIALSPFY